MNNNQSTNKKFDIHDRIFDFVARILNLIKSLPKTQQNLILINQITRSSTSIGANDQEADGARTRKETKETNYWLKMISTTNSGFSKRMENLIKEGLEIEASDS